MFSKFMISCFCCLFVLCILFLYEFGENCCCTFFGIFALLQAKSQRVINRVLNVLIPTTRYDSKVKKLCTCRSQSQAY